MYKKLLFVIISGHSGGRRVGQQGLPVPQVDEAGVVDLEVEGAVGLGPHASGHAQVGKGVVGHIVQKGLLPVGAVSIEPVEFNVVVLAYVLQKGDELVDLFQVLLRGDSIGKESGGGSGPGGQEGGVIGQLGQDPHFGPDDPSHHSGGLCPAQRTAGRKGAIRIHAGEDPCPEEPQDVFIVGVGKKADLLNGRKLTVVQHGPQHLQKPAPGGPDPRGDPQLQVLQIAQHGRVP